MTSASNHLAIYLIVALNAASQIMLIWRLKLDKRAKLKFSSVAVAIPLVVMTAMRLLVSLGVMHMRVAEQVGVEKVVTVLASILLVAGPPIGTALAVISRGKARSELSQEGLAKA